MNLMNRTERFYLIDQLLTARGVMNRQALLDELRVSWSTLKRDLLYLKDRFHAPIVFDREAGGYRFDSPNVGPKYELPGLWFNGEETYALLTMHQLLTELEPGLLAPHIAPLLSRLEAIVGQDELRFEEVRNHIRLARIGTRRKNPIHFDVVSRAILEQKRIRIRHYNRNEDTHTERELSPHRLTFYRNNWYLEAWCHLRKDLRRFSVDALEQVELLTQAAKAVSPAKLDAAFMGSYGIYGGENTQTAVLRFSAAAARWVADEEWHPNQVGKLESDGRYVLEVPYADPTELMMDIQRHGHHVEVLGPPALRDAVRSELQQATALYAE
jgi:predicted DNA-binding transcriptional regulator YafY